MTEIDRNTKAMIKHHNAMFALIDEIFATPKITATPPLEKETWLVRQLKNMRIDAQLAGHDHEADVLMQAVEELGGKL
jgi:hypothetical protein